MIDKAPMSYPLLTYLWVIGLSAWGGVANYIRKVRSGQSEHFSFLEVVGEICISGFAGVLTFWLCELGGMPPLLTAAFVGISGHMGSRGIALLEDKFKRKWGIRPESNQSETSE